MNFLLIGFFVSIVAAIIVGALIHYFGKPKPKKETPPDTRRKEAEEAVANCKKKMLIKPCLINSNQNCFDGCVHFQDGWVWEIPPCGHLEWCIVPRYPKCKLWKD